MNSQLWYMGSSSLTKDQTQAPCIGSTESYPLNYQRNPYKYFLTWGTTAPQNLESMDLMGRKSRDPGLWRTTLLILKYLSVKYQCIPSKKGFTILPKSPFHLWTPVRTFFQRLKNPTGLRLHSGPKSPTKKFNFLTMSTAAP